MIPSRPETATTTVVMTTVSSAGTVSVVPSAILTVAVAVAAAVVGV